MSRTDVFPQGGNESRDGMVATPFQGPEYAHQHPVGQRALIAAVAGHDLADQRSPWLLVTVTSGWLKNVMNSSQYLAIEPGGARR